MGYAMTKEAAHELIERMPVDKVPMVVDTLHRLLDPLAYSLANAPMEDEEISDEEKEACARADAETGPGTSMEEFMAELGITQEDLDRVGREQMLPARSR